MWAQEPLRIELRCIGAVQCTVTVTLPEVCDTNSPLGNEYPFIPIVLYRGVWDAQRAHGAPPKGFFD